MSRHLVKVLLIAFTIFCCNDPVYAIKRKPLSISKADIRRDHPAHKMTMLEEKNRVEDKSLISVAAGSVPSEENNPAYMKIFPVKPSEFPKFLSLSFMMFWIVFVFTMTRDTKDALIVTNCGAESIAFLKVYGVIPAATGFMLLYSKMSSVLSTKALFYTTLFPFFVFYAAFAFILYPLRQYLHPLSLTVPKGGLSFAVNLLRYWTFSLYYIVSELWGSAGVPLLFWTCANDVIKIDEASRLYPLIPLIGNLGPILSGLMMSIVSRKVKRYVSGNDDHIFELSLKILTITMLLAGGLIASLHHLVREIQTRENNLNNANENESHVSSNISNDSNKKTSKDAKANDGRKGQANQTQSTSISTADKATKHPDKKPKMTFLQSLQFLGKDKYLRNVATMVLCYGLTMEFTEIVWKATVKRAFPVRSDYLEFNGRCSTLVGTASFVMMIVGVNVVKILGWKAGALMTPLMMGLLAAPFFGCLIFGGINPNKNSGNSAAVQKNLLIAVYVGLVQNALSKGTKYAIFDPTKEMTYIPLDKDSKTKGKAAIDVLGARLGKSGGALAQQFLVVLFGNIITGAPVLTVLFYLAISAWTFSVLDLAPMFKAKIAMSSGKESKES